MGIDQINHAKTGPGRFVTVGGTNAALRSADFVLPFEQFPLLVDHPMIGQDEVSGFAQEQVAVDLHAQLQEAFDFPDQGKGIDDHAIPDNAHFVITEDARRNEVEDVFLFAYIYSMAGVVPPLAANDDVGLFGENIDDLSLTFIAPLGANKDCIRHTFN